MKISRGKALIILGVLLVVIDQVIKFLVKTNMTIGEHFNVLGSWFQILFIENEGMAFGMKFGGSVGKLLLTIFRLVLFGVLCWWISSLNKKGAQRTVKAEDGRASKVYVKVPTGVLVGLTLITAGAFGNIVDCVLYGTIFSASTTTSVAALGGSYAPLLYGKVVDMLYFPLIHTQLPDWLPFFGGKTFSFFDPVFNFADSCVTVGAFYLILFHYKFFMSDSVKDPQSE